MSDRELVLEAVRGLPDNLTLREIVEELLLLDEVKARLAKSERNAPGVPHEDGVKLLDSWITK